MRWPSCSSLSDCTPGARTDGRIGGGARGAHLGPAGTLYDARQLPTPAHHQAPSSDTYLLPNDPLTHPPMARSMTVMDSAELIGLLDLEIDTGMLQQASASTTVGRAGGAEVVRLRGGQRCTRLHECQLPGERGALGGPGVTFRVKGGP